MVEEGRVRWRVSMGESRLTITAVGGIEVGHATDLVGLTGCTVVLCGQGAVGRRGTARRGTGDPRDGSAAAAASGQRGPRGTPGGRFCLWSGRRRWGGPLSGGAGGGILDDGREGADRASLPSCSI